MSVKRKLKSEYSEISKKNKKLKMDHYETELQKHIN